MCKYLVFHDLSNLKKVVLILATIVFCANIHAQKMSGYIYSYEKNEPLIGVNVYYKYKNQTAGTISNIDGYYELDMPVGNLYVIFSYIEI